MTQLTQIATEMNIRDTDAFANLLNTMYRAHTVYGNIKQMNEIDVVNLTQLGMNQEDAVEFVDAFKTDSEFRCDFVRLANRHQE